MVQDAFSRLAFQREHEISRDSLANECHTKWKNPNIMFQVHERVSLLQHGRRVVLRSEFDPDNLRTQKVVLAGGDQPEYFQEED